MFKNLFMLAGLLFASGALAQDLDAHGFNLVPSDGDLKDGLSTWRSESHQPGSLGLNALFEYAAEPLVLHRVQDGVETETVLIDDLTAVNLGVFYSPHPRLSLTVAAPVYLSVDDFQGPRGVGIGDFRVASAVTILKPDQGLSLGLSAVPFLDVPGSYQRSQLSSTKPSGGLMGVASLGEDKWEISANLGVHLTPETDFYNLRGKERLVTQLSAAYELTSDVALRGELVAKPSLRNNDFNGTESPVEALASLRGYTGRNLGWTIGGAKALNRGVSAATWRAFAGLDLAFGARTKELCPDCEPARLWISTEGPPPKMTMTDGRTTLVVKRGDIVKLPSDGDILLKVVTEPCVKMEGDKILLLKPILFDFDQATIRMPDSHQVMTELVTTLKAHPEIALLEIATGTDTRGSVEYNQDLSQRRADSVAKFLVEHGINSKILTTIGYGESRLKEKDCRTEECHEKNRYSEFTIKAVEEKTEDATSE